MSAEFVACMEDVLDLYAEPYDPERPVVCFDETSKQLLAEKRSPIPPKPARRERYDYEYQRNGHPKPVHAVRAPGGLEACGSDRTSYHGGLRSADAVAGR